MENIIFLDLETTGLDRDKDRIIEVALVDLAGRELCSYVNPGVPILNSDIHGITDAMVAGSPSFQELAPTIVNFLGDQPLAGFNSNYFDVPFLAAELERAGHALDWTQRILVDVGNLYKIQHPRTLSHAVKTYLNREHTEAHSAKADAAATREIFYTMTLQEELPKALEELALYSNFGKHRADLDGKFYIDENGLVKFAFGKYKDQPALAEPDYLNWMLGANFSIDTKIFIKKLLA